MTPWQEFGWACLGAFFFAFVVAPLVLAYLERGTDV